MGQIFTRGPEFPETDAGDEVMERLPVTFLSRAARDYIFLRCWFYHVYSIPPDTFF
jgi:hypothetical protein